MINFKCACQRTLIAARKNAGQVIECPSCRRHVEVPNWATKPAPTPSPPPLPVAVAAAPPVELAPEPRRDWAGMVLAAVLWFVFIFGGLVTLAQASRPRQPGSDPATAPTLCVMAAGFLAIRRRLPR